MEWNDEMWPTPALNEQDEFDLANEEQLFQHERTSAEIIERCERGQLYAKTFWQWVRIAEGCWGWEGSKDTGGYGRLWIAGKTFAAHRISWELTNGAIPLGLLVLHRCDNRECVNPAHLFLGTHTDNMRDKMAKGRHVAWQSAKTHCPRGHEYSSENTNHFAGRNGRFRCRVCRTCDRERHRRSAS